MEGVDIFNRRRIVVMGSRSVGKSSLVVQFMESRFVSEYYPTIENTHSKIVEYGGTEYQCDIIDTAGQDQFSILHGKYAIGIHGYVLVYSIGSQDSFDMVKIVYDKIIDFSGFESVPVVIVGQKSDLPRREVSTEQAQALAGQLGCAWIETSARDNINVGKAFELCLAEMEKKYRRSVALPPPSNGSLLT